MLLGAASRACLLLLGLLRDVPARSLSHMGEPKEGAWHWGAGCLCYSGEEPLL